MIWRGPSQTVLWSLGPWWLCVQRYRTNFGTFHGLKLGPLGIYARWSTPDPEEA